MANLALDVQLRMKFVTVEALVHELRFPTRSAMVLAEVLVDHAIELVKDTGRTLKANYGELADDGFYYRIRNILLDDIPSWKRMESSWPGDNYTVIKAFMDARRAP